MAFKPRHWSLCLGAVCAFLVVAMAHGRSAVQAPPAVFSRQDLLSGAHAAASRIDDLHIAFTFHVRGNAPSEYLGTHVRQEVYTRGGRLYSSFEFGTADRLQHRQVAFNGAFTTTYTPHTSTAAVQDGLRRIATLDGSGFFDIAMLIEPRADGAYTPGSLVYLLQSSHASVRPLQEQIDGRWVHVVDLNLDGSARVGPLTTVWIDTERGFAPVLQRHYATNGALVVEFQVSELRSFGNDVWLPIAGERRSFPVGSAAALLPEPLITEMRIETGTDGLPMIRINSGFGDEIFDLYERLPPGTIVLWEASGVTAGAFVGSYPDAAKVPARTATALVAGPGRAADSVQQETLGGASLDAPHGPSSAAGSAAEQGSGSLLWLVLFAAGIVAGIVLVYVRLRK